MRRVTWAIITSKLLKFHQIFHATSHKEIYFVKIETYARTDSFFIRNH